ncbi:MAG: hypothetical protein AAGJ82_06425 [Bacteroidota bacterium]
MLLLLGWTSSVTGQSDPVAHLLAAPTVTAFLPVGSWWWETGRRPLPQYERPKQWATRYSFAANYRVADLAFFCRLEVQLEKAARLPVRFRLGDVQQVDYLEGKFEGWRYGY